MSFELRPYQTEAIEKTGGAFDRGVTRVLGVAATGLGKTIIFANLAKQFISEGRESRILILAHRDELISQAVEKILHEWPEADIGVIKAERDEWDHAVVVASVQTLGRQSRLTRIPRDHFSLIVTDECHHSRANSYRAIYTYFGVDEGTTRHLGVTATPDRGDKKGLDEVYDEIIFNYDLLWGIRSGYLADMRGRRVTIDGFDTSGIKISKGDFEAGSSGRAMEDANAPDQIAEAWVKFGEDRKTIIFTPTVAVAGLIRDCLRYRGVDAEMVSGETPLEERRGLLERFKGDSLRVMVNCMVLTEGFDEPSVSCIVMARPTRARSLYSQCVGRGSRKHPGKSDCLVMDCVGVSEEHSLVTVPSLFGIRSKDAFKDASGTIAGATLAQDEEDVRLGRLESRAIELFRKVLESPIAWIAVKDKFNRNVYTCGLGSGQPSTVLEHDGSDSDEAWRFYLRWPESRTAPPGEVNVAQFPNEEWYRVVGSGIDLETAQNMAEDFIRKNSVAALVDRNAKWRKGAPTEKQLDLAVKLGIGGAEKMSKGELSEKISEKIESRKAKTRDNKKPEWLKRKLAAERERMI